MATVGLLGIMLAASRLVEAQVAATVIDSAPRKLYSELYSDEGGNQFLVEVYEESQDGQSQLHFRAFKNGSLITTKSQVVAESHNFSFFVDEQQDRLMRPKAEDFLIKVFSRLFLESDARMRQAMLEVFNEEKVAQHINENLQVPPGEVDEEELAKLLAPNIKPVVDDEALAKRLSGQIKPIVDDEALAKRLSGQIKPMVDDEALAKRLSGQIKPVVDDEALAKRLSSQIKPMVDDEALAKRLSSQIKPMVDDEALAKRLSSQIKPMVDDEALAKHLSGQIKPVVDHEALVRRLVDDGLLAEQLSKKIRPVVDDEALAARLSGQIKPVVDDEALAKRLSKQVKPVVDEQALARRLVDDGLLAEQLSSKVKPIVDDEALAARLSKQIKPVVDDKALAKRLSTQIKSRINEKQLADRLSSKIKPSPVNLNEEALAVALAIKLTERERVAALKVRKYPELLSEVEQANRAGDYEKTLQLLDEDLANRTPEEQRKALKISGIMSVLVGAKKMKRALSTINDYDLPDDPELRQLHQSLDLWLQNNLVLE
jgi:GMP synthase PP-ATPase subunit